MLTSDLGDAAAGCGNYRGILVHEMGHALGLAHVVYPTVAVMRSDIASLTTAAPKADDVNGIDHLY